MLDQLIEEGNDITNLYLSDSSNVYRLDIYKENPHSAYVVQGIDNKIGSDIYRFDEINKNKEYLVGVYKPGFNNVLQPEKNIWTIILLRNDRLAIKSNYNGKDYKFYFKAVIYE